jgi:transcriptional regulator with XRE-family HTH domain
MTQKPSRNKRKIAGIRIKPQEGLWIVYRLRLVGIRQVDLAARLGVSTATVAKVLSGKTKSTRIETALYQILGYPSFGAMVAASRGREGGAA